MLKTPLLAIFASTSFFAFGQAAADEFRLKNGDRITGAVVSAEGGIVVIRPDFAKSTTIAISQSDISTFSANAPVVLKMKDGTVVSQGVNLGSDGKVTVAAPGTLANQSLAINQIDRINPQAPPPIAWHGSIGANGLYSKSNSDSLALGLSADATRATAIDELNVNFGYNYGEQKVGGISTTNAENWSANAKYDFKLSRKFYIYSKIQASEDKVNFLNLRFVPSIGVGYRWIDQPNVHFSTDAGFAWIYQDYKTSPQSTKNAAATLSYHFDDSWSEGRIKIFHDLQLLPSLDSGEIVIVTDAGLRTALTKSMYSEIKLDANYDNKPAPGSKSTTTQLKIGLGWIY